MRSAAAVACGSHVISWGSERRLSIWMLIRSSWVRESPSSHKAVVVVVAESMEEAVG